MKQDRPKSYFASHQGIGASNESSTSSSREEKLPGRFIAIRYESQE
jgi:hypothetical protein